MPHLNHKGPEGKGPKTGRKLGMCKKKQDEKDENHGTLGIGMGKMLKNNANTCPGKGKRLKAGKDIE